MPRAKRVSVVLWIATLALAAGLVLFAYASTSTSAALRSVDRTLEMQRESDEWMVAVLDAAVSGRSYVISGDRELREPFHAALARERTAAARVKSLAATDQDQTQNVEAAETEAEGALNEIRVLATLAGAGHLEDARARMASSVVTERLEAFRENWRRIGAQEEDLLGTQRGTANERAALAVSGATVLALASFALLAFAWRAQRSRERLLGELARDARERLNALSDVAVALSNARTRQEVADVVVRDGMGVLGADTCTLHLLDESGTVLELATQRGVAPAVVAAIRRIRAGDGNAAFESLRSDTPLWVETEAAYAEHFPKLAKLQTGGRRAKAFFGCPLIVESKPVGLLGMGFYQERTFSDDDRTLVQTLAKQCAQALVRAQRLEREDEARRWFTTTLTSIGDGVIATDPDGRVTFMNPIAAQLTGFALDEARGRPLDEVFQIFSEATRTKVESPAKKVLREGAVIGLANHTLLRSKHGREIPIEDSGAPIRGEGGQLAGVVLVFRDVTREKADRARREFLSKASEALVASLDYQLTLANVARLAVPIIADWCSVHILEPGQTVPYQAAVAHADQSKVDFVRALGERYPPDPNARQGAPEVIRTGKSELYSEIPETLLEVAARDREHLRLIRELKLHSAMVVPLRGRNRVLGAMSFVHAESRRRYTEDDLAFGEDFARRAALAIENSLALRAVEEARAHEQRLRAEAEVASRAKDEFLAMVSHELRTPLNAVLGWAVTLRKREPAPDIERGLAIIERNARSQAKLIEDVLDVSRIISGKLALNLGPTNVTDAVTAAIETIAPAAAAKNISVVRNFRAVPMTILADADRVQQIVWNLLSNAVKFTPKGGDVKVNLERDGSNVLIGVSDTGEGIRQEALPYIFDLFQQADASTTRRHGGLGLGLAIVKQLVSAHGGSVRATSDGFGKGATFIVELPARSAVPVLDKAHRPRGAPEPAVGAPDLPRLDGMKLLIVDDEEDALSLLGDVLRERGAEVHCAGSAKEAFERFERIHPDVLVSDIGMPHEDGHTLMRRIRMLPDERGGRTPSIALTAYARDEDARRAFAAGYQRHVPKPVEPDYLVNVVAKLGGRTLESRS